jgi:hypothetical protein
MTFKTSYELGERKETSETERYVVEFVCPVLFTYVSCFVTTVPWEEAIPTPIVSIRKMFWPVVDGLYVQCR